jgi:hypothetical protein
MLRADRSLLDHLPVDQLDAIVRIQHAGLTHPVILV